MAAAVQVLPTNAGWVNYFGGEIQMHVFWVSPGKGSFILESSTDLTNWQEAGSWNPGGANAYYTINADDYDVFNVAYRMRVAGTVPINPPAR